jgi:hypothetical protein
VVKGKLGVSCCRVCALSHWQFDVSCREVDRFCANASPPCGASCDFHNPYHRSTLQKHSINQHGRPRTLQSISTITGPRRRHRNLEKEPITIQQVCQPQSQPIANPNNELIIYTSKRYSEYFDPCQEAADRSLKCLRRNGGDRLLCADYFE